MSQLPPATPLSKSPICWTNIGTRHWTPDNNQIKPAGKLPANTQQQQQQQQQHQDLLLSKSSSWQNSCACLTAPLYSSPLNLHLLGQKSDQSEALVIAILTLAQLTCGLT
jgi:hypothetical protein